MKDLIFLDGGMGTLLQARGLKPGECPEDWNVERPDDVIAVHRAYVAAGSNVVYANTFGANRLKYHGRHTVAEVVKAAIANARKAASEDLPSIPHPSSLPRVALDIGPTGRLLKPVGDLDFDEAVAAFKETIRAAVGAERTEDKGRGLWTAGHWTGDT